MPFSSLHFGLAALFILCGCTKPPDIPTLPRRNPPLMSSFLLRQSITVKDVRELYGAINHDGKINSLKRYIEEPSDETLREIGDLIYRYLYQDAFSETGLLHFIDKRAGEKKFTALRSRVQRWLASPYAPAERELAIAAVSLEELPALVARDLELASPEVVTIAIHLWNKSLEFEGTSSGVTGSLLVADLDRFLSDGKTRADFLKLADYLYERSIGHIGFDLFGKARAQTGQDAFLGFGRSVAFMLTPTNRFDGLLSLTKLLDGPTDGLFTVAAEKLNEGDTQREMASFLQPDLPGGIAGFVRESVMRLPFKSMLQRFIAIRTGIESITGKAHAEEASDYLLANLPIYLNAYALVKWWEAAGKIEANHTLWAQMEKGITPDAWNQPVIAPAFELNLLEAKEVKVGEEIVIQYFLDPKVKKDLGTVGVGPFAELLETDVKQEGLGNFLYRFSEPEAKRDEDDKKPARDKKPTLRRALEHAIAECHRIRPFADPSSFVRAVLRKITHSEKGSLFSLSRFETPNIMDSLSRAIVFLGRSEWPSVKRLLFEDLKIGELTAERRKLPLSLFEKRPDLKTKLNDILDRVKYIYEFDREIGGLPSGFSMYQRLLEELPRDDKHAATATLSFLYDARFFGGTPQAPDYPGLYQLASSGDSLGGAAYALANVEPRDQNRLLAALSKALGPELGVEFHLYIVERLLRQEPAGLAALIDRLSVENELIDPESYRLPPDEWMWVTRFVGKYDHEKLWRFLKQHGSRENLIQLADELLELSRSGRLAESLKLLSQVDNERIQELARVLTKMDESGELRESLETARMLLKP